MLSAPALAEDRRADLDGFQVVPAISTTGQGEFRARISSDETSIDFELSYSGLQGVVTNATLHLGQPGVNGGISAILCGFFKPACPASPATVSGTLTAADVIGQVSQGISPGQLGELVNAMRERVTYIRVGTTFFPAAEVRGQIR